MNAILNTLVADVVAENANKAEMPTSEQQTAQTQSEQGTLPSQTVSSGHHNPMEKVYQQKYPHLDIIPGSMVQEKDHPKFKNKVRVQVRCGCKLGDGPKCTEIVERATSDLFTFLGCEECKKVVRKVNKAAKALASVSKS